MVVYALLPTTVLALLAGLDELVMKVRLIASVVLCYSTYIAMSIVHNGISDILLFLCLIRTTIFSLNEKDLHQRTCTARVSLLKFIC